MTCGSKTDEKSSPTKRSAASPPNANLDHLRAKKAKIEVTLAASEAGQLTQIESEFQILKSLIPNIADKQQINEVRYLHYFYSIQNDSISRRHPEYICQNCYLRKIFPRMFPYIFCESFKSDLFFFSFYSWKSLMLV